MRERRKSKRYELAQFGKYKKVSGCVSISSLATIRNISLGGLCAILSRVVEKGDKLLIELYLPYNRRLAAFAKVIWTKPFANTKGQICGIKFLEVSSPLLLKGYIAYVKRMADTS